MLGMLALAESSWVETFNLQQLQGYLQRPGVLYQGWDMTIKSRILDAYALLRIDTDGPSWKM